MWKPIVILLVAAASIVWGVSMWSVPAAWIVAGVLLAAFALLWDWPEQPTRRRPTG